MWEDVPHLRQVIIDIISLGAIRVGTSHVTQLLIVIEEERLLGSGHVGQEAVAESAEMPRDHRQRRVLVVQRPLTELHNQRNDCVRTCIYRE